MNRYPAWKYALIVIVVLLGALYALPNVFGQDPAVQVSARNGEMAPEIDARVQSLLEGSGLSIAGMRREQDTLLVRFEDRGAQRTAREVLADTLGDDYSVALNLASAAPAWLREIGGRPLNLGLDLRGGVHFLLEVDMVAAIEGALEQKVGDIRRVLREEGIRYRGVTLDEGSIRVRFIDEADRDSALDLLEREYRDLRFASPETGGRPFVTARLTEVAAEEERQSALEQNVTTLRNRVDELGIAEPVVTRQGRERIVVQLPGVQDTTRAKEILGATATLEFRLVHGTSADWRDAAQSGNTPFDAALYRHRDGRPVLLKREIIVTGDQIVDAASSFDNRTGSPVVVVNLNNAGASRMQDVTAEHVGDPMAVVFIENRVETNRVDGELVKERTRVEEVVNIATINDVLSHRFQIEGLTLEEARDLSLLLRAGALTAPVEIIEERTIGPSLGQDNINQGMLSVLVGLVLVVVFMTLYYRVFGVFANLALLANLVIVIAVLSALQATLTLPGIAGIVLTVGMAVDANVLIFERVREELRAGNSVQASIHAGYDRAIGTIADANVTTLIAALVLMMMGTGPIKGFAITLSIGIVASMFTAIMGTRALVNGIYGGRRLSSLPV